jgi:hypothetical protein
MTTPSTDQLLAEFLALPPGVAVGDRCTLLLRLAGRLPDTRILQAIFALFSHPNEDFEVKGEALGILSWCDFATDEQSATAESIILDLIRQNHDVITTTAAIRAAERFLNHPPALGAVVQHLLDRNAEENSRSAAFLVLQFHADQSTVERVFSMLLDDPVLSRSARNVLEKMKHS